MLKLLTAYRDNPTIANARKLRAYVRNHPFAHCLLAKPEMDELMATLASLNVQERAQ